MPTTSDDLLNAASEALRASRTSLMEGGRLLYQVRETKAWEGHFESFSDFLESECQIKDSFASKLITIYQHYCIAGGVSQAKLTGIDSEKLYLAASLEGDATSQLAAAETLSRQELRQEIRESLPDHIHEYIHVCKICWKKEDQNED